jgi:predicted Fe-S protein YdhL (DUF1289 family)
MGAMTFRRFIVIVLLLVACARTTATRAQWLQMSPDEKTLYVRSLLGHEQATKAKGGNARTFPNDAQTYVARIDAAYAHGEQRGVDEVFESLGTPP